MIKHEFGNQNKVRIFFNISVVFLPFSYFTKLPFFLYYCPNFVSFSKLLANYFFNEDGSNINQFPFLMLTHIDDRRRQSSSELLYVICFEFLGPSKLSHSNFAWKGSKRCGIGIPRFPLFSDSVSYPFPTMDHPLLLRLPLSSLHPTRTFLFLGPDHCSFSWANSTIKAFTPIKHFLNDCFEWWLEHNL